MELEHLTSEERELLGQYLQQGVQALTRKSQAADELKDIVDVVHEKWESIEKPVFRDAVNTAFKATLSDKVARLDAVAELVELALSTLPKTEETNV